MRSKFWREENPAVLENAPSTVPPASIMADDIIIEKFVSICRQNKKRYNNACARQCSSSRIIP